MRAGRRPRGRARCFPSRVADGPSRPPEVMGMPWDCIQGGLCPSAGPGCPGQRPRLPRGKTRSACASLGSDQPPHRPPSGSEARSAGSVPAEGFRGGACPAGFPRFPLRRPLCCAQVQLGGRGGLWAHEKGAHAPPPPAAASLPVPSPRGFSLPTSHQGWGRAGARPPRSDLDS